MNVINLGLSIVFTSNILKDFPKKHIINHHRYRLKQRICVLRVLVAKLVYILDTHLIKYSNINYIHSYFVGILNVVRAIEVN